GMVIKQLSQLSLKVRTMEGKVNKFSFLNTSEQLTGYPIQYSWTQIGYSCSTFRSTSLIGL
ncbi:MAG: hypothetical protein JXB07_05310, partial [Anaerolineae bacterium]|nr:hypothetical protein [Anaerolineae bacterium]